MKPSDIKSIDPMGSVLQNSESETIARNICVILSRTGDTFRKLSWEEYQAERLKDGGFSEREKPYFDKVAPYFVSAECPPLFCSAYSLTAKS